jgi:hypothetical protein
MAQTTLDIMNHTCTCTCTVAVTPDIDDDVLQGNELPIFKPIMRAVLEEASEVKPVQAVTTQQRAKMAARWKSRNSKFLLWIYQTSQRRTVAI